ncbi:MAG: hypothetical protein MJ025_04050, partial [Victivallaceae bacterium]|nr:hypothetical protein [Victivallaceae bacterium]
MLRRNNMMSPVMVMLLVALMVFVIGLVISLSLKSSEVEQKQENLEPQEKSRVMSATERLLRLRLFHDIECKDIVNIHKT